MSGISLLNKLKKEVDYKIKLQDSEKKEKNEENFNEPLDHLIQNIGDKKLLTDVLGRLADKFLEE